MSFTCAQCKTSFKSTVEDYITIEYCYMGKDSTILYCRECFCKMAGQEFFDNNLKAPIMKEMADENEFQKIRKEIVEKVYNGTASGKALTNSEKYINDLKYVLIDEMKYQMKKKGF